MPRANLIHLCIVICWVIFITLHNYSTLLSASIIPCIRSLWFICYLALPISLVTSILLYFFTGLTFLDSMYNWYHIALVFWFILLTIIYSRSIHVVTTGRISSFLMTKLLCMCTTCVLSMHLLMSIWAVSILGQCEYALPCLLKRYSQAVLLKGCYSSHIQSILPWTNGKKRGSWPSTERDRNTIRNLFSFFFRVSPTLP